MGCDSGYAKEPELIEGSQVRQDRQKRGISQAQFAKFAGLAQHMLSAFELDKADLPGPMKRRIQEAFEKLDRFHRSEGQPFFSKTRWSVQYGRRRYNNRPGTIDLETARAFARACLVEREDTPRPLRGISLFSGCGGMSLGFRDAGFEILGSVELNEAARAIFHENFPEAQMLGTNVQSIKKGDVAEWRRRFRDVDVLFGGPPCQGFSLTGKRDRWDTRNQLYRSFARIAGVLQPRMVVLENVRLLTSMKSPEGEPVPACIMREFENQGFVMRYRALNAQDFAVPQFRERVFFVGIRRGLGFEPSFPCATHGKNESGTLFKDLLTPFRTLRDAIADLEPLESGEQSRDPLHWAVSHPDHVIEMLIDVPEGHSAHENTDPRKRPKSGYNTTYKRLQWDEPSSTISTTFGMISGSRNVHPSSTRSLTIREAMRCQTFPDHFVMFGRVGDIRTSIGNAVPPRLAYSIAMHLRKLSNGKP